MLYTDQLQTWTNEERRFQLNTARIQALCLVQTPAVRQHFVEQGQIICQAILQGSSKVQFRFPERIRLLGDDLQTWREENIARRYRQQWAGNRLLRGRSGELVKSFIQRMSELQSSADEAIATCAEIIRYQTALALFSSLPRKVVEETSSGVDALAASTLEEAECQVHELEGYVHVLTMAFAVEPAIGEEEAYSNMTSRMIQRLIEAGLSYCQRSTLQIISTIRQRVAQNSLNRGLSVSIPYFDDEVLQLRRFDLEVIPPSRILFEPIFVVNAVQEAKKMVSDDPNLSPGTRQHLFEQLEVLEKSFEFGNQYMTIGMVIQANGYSVKMNDKRGSALR
ncbi:MAG: hypothetical protein ACOY16_02925 [Chloroflexota bacterium]